VKDKPTSRCCSFGHSSRSLFVEVVYQTKGLRQADNKFTAQSTVVLLAHEIQVVYPKCQPEESDILLSCMK
jgi:hypothetical protein